MHVLFGILAVLVGAVAAFTLLSFAFAWYERANSEPQLIERRFALRNLWLALRLVTLEAAVLLVTVLLHPCGWFKPRGKIRNHPGTPVLLLHGLFQSRACWLWMKWRLRRRGFASIYALSLPPWKDVELLTERLAKKVDELRHRTGIEKVHLVGHSMGGMIVRNYLQIRGGEKKVAACVLLGTPNHGSKLAPFALSPLGKLLMPGSDFLRRLNEAPVPAGARVVSIYSRHENVVLPFQNARLEGAADLELAGMGHTSLLFHPRAFALVLENLQGESP